MPSLSTGLRRDQGEVQIKRVYDPASPADGRRFLVDRLWPRGLSTTRLRLDGWGKDAAPSDALRRWFSHDVTKWPGFVRRYRAELNARPRAWKPLVDAARRGPITLLFAARDAEHNNAVVLRTYLMARLRPSRRRQPRRTGRASLPRRRPAQSG